MHGQRCQVASSKAQEFRGKTKDEDTFKRTPDARRARLNPMPARRADHRATSPSGVARSRGGEFSATSPRDLLGAALVVSVAVALIYASHTEEPSQRKLLGEVVALQLYADLDRPPSSKPLSADEDVSSAAPGRPGGYRRAVMFHDPLLPCPRSARPVDCGAKLEIFRQRSSAVDRVAILADDSAEITVRRGALVLRLSSDLPTERRIAYQDSFVAAVDELVGFRELARLDQSAT